MIFRWKAVKHQLGSIPWDEIHHETHQNFWFTFFKSQHFEESQIHARTSGNFADDDCFTRFSMAEVGAAPGATLKGRHAAGRPSPMPGPGRKWWGGGGSNGEGILGGGRGNDFCFFFCMFLSELC